MTRRSLFAVLLAPLFRLKPPDPPLPITITARDAEFIESRKFQVAEVARIFRVPPHLIGSP